MMIERHTLGSRVFTYVRSLRIRALVDLVVTLVMGVAAAVMIWRGIATPERAQARSPSAKPAFEDVSAKQLTTTLEGVPIRGAETAPLILIEFADFECPFCRKYHQEVFPKVDETLVATRKVRYAFRHFPLEKVHFNAIGAARAADCAAKEGKFWEMRAQLFQRQPEIGRAFWVPAARELGLRADSFEDCLRRSDDTHIRRDQEEAAHLGINATPTFLVGIAEGKSVRVLRKIEGAHAFNVFNETVELLTRTGVN
jgi:protein-disulfide isomerase